jgi:hypothetical protein
MRRNWIGVAGMFALAGCMTEVDREAVSFPDMPNMPIYQRADSRQLPPDQVIDALQVAVSNCRTQIANSVGSSPTVGSPVFDSCMRGQGYRRTR